MLSPEDYERARELFHEVFELDEGERTRILRERAPNSQVRAEVEFMLGATADDAFADENLGSSNPALIDDLQAAHEGSQRIGPYQIVGKLGEGGMGIVYLAKQQNPQRTIAVKVLRWSPFGTEGVRRFEREAELLGRLQHPGIAQIFESGTVRRDDGEAAYIAMEHIDGVPLTDHVSREGLDVSGRVALLVDLIRAVHHAHLRGVLHRDLKPSNVLVTTDGQVKVIDFGIARQLDADSDVTQATLDGQVIGTLNYMSPEQARGDVDAIDARTDVYALGVIAYELLSGKLPLDLREVAIPECARIINDVEPARLGTVTSSCRGDLELIVGKALSKEPERRYQSASAFADDLERYCSFEPIEARATSIFYQLRRMARRHRAVVGGAIATVAAIVVGAAIAIHLAIKNAAETAKVLRLSDVQLLRELIEDADDLWPAHPNKIADLEAWRLRGMELLHNLPKHRETLDQMRSESSAVTEQSQEVRWQLQVLSGLVDGLEQLENGLLADAPDANTEEHGWSIPRRLAFARDLKTAFATDGDFTRRWRSVIPKLRARYPKVDFTPQLGLVPLGPDGKTGLWEFADLTTGTIPERDANGKLALTDDTALVFVLLPSGTFRMGAQSKDKQAPNYNVEAHDDEGPVHEMTISAFFLSKYEMTQGQWKRLTGKNPSANGIDGLWEKNWSKSGTGATLLHPVETVSWQDCFTWLTRAGLTLPSEAQWEYGCRAGTTTDWWTGAKRESLRGAANLSDGYAIKNGMSGAPDAATWLDDGYSVHAPVGEFRANAFGLHDVHGNVWEWCLDGYDGHAYELEPRLDRVIPWKDATLRIYRGGGADGIALDARVADRNRFSPGVADGFIGVRPARLLQRR